MSTKTFDLPDIGLVKITKRKGSRNIRIRLTNSSEVVVSQPAWLPYSAGTEFAKSHREWISSHRPDKKLFTQNMPVGKDHTLIFVRTESQKPSVKIKGKYAVAYVPAGMKIQNTDIQATAKRAAQKALTKQAAILEERLAELAQIYGYKYSEVRFKFMKSKWGSRRSDGRITLNYRLLDLSDRLIDYVICHELAHTDHMNHSAAFWQSLAKMQPDYKTLKKELKGYHFTW